MHIPKYNLCSEIPEINLSWQIHLHRLYTRGFPNFKRSKEIKNNLIWDSDLLFTLPTVILERSFYLLKALMIRYVKWGFELSVVFNPFLSQNTRDDPTQAHYSRRLPSLPLVMLQWEVMARAYVTQCGCERLLGVPDKGRAVSVFMGAVTLIPFLLPLLLL